MIKKRILFLIGVAVLFGAVSWLPNSSSAEEIEYTLATDDDFAGSRDGEFVYIGNDEYVEIPHIIKGVLVTSYLGMFSGSNDANTGQLKGVKSTNKNVTSMSWMFSDAISLTELDLSNFDTSNVTDMSYMFSDVSNLTELDLSNFDTSNVTSMSGMFWGANSLTELDLSNFDTSNVTDMSYMFYGANSLTKLDLRGFELSQTHPAWLRNMFIDSNIKLIYAKSVLDAERLKHPNTFGGEFPSEYVKVIPIHYPEVVIDESAKDYVKNLEIKPHITQFVLKGKESNYDDDDGEFLPIFSLFAKGDVYEKSNDADITSYQYVLTKNPIPDSSGWRNVGDGGTIIVEGITGDYYLHVRVENEQGETASATSGVLKLDNTPPSIELTPSTTDVVEETNIYVQVKDEHSGIEKVTLPDGTETNESEFTFPVTKNGTYTFEAIDRVGNSTTESITINNIGLPATPLEPAMTNVSVEKRWKGERQEKVTINLLADGKKIDSVELSDDNDWQHVFANLPTMYDIKDSKLIEYTVEEVEISGYEVSITGSARDGFVITNTRTGEIEIPVEKKWKLYEKEAQAIEVKLLQNGVEIERVELSEGNNWRHVFSKPLYDEEGEIYTYTVEEIEVEGFESVVIGNQKDGYVITNTEVVKQIPLEPAMTSVSVEKQWEGKQQDKVVVNLLANGNVIDSIELSNANGWRHTFTDLPIKNDIKDSEEIKYTVSEVPIEGYENSVVEKSKNNYVIINTEVVESTPDQPDESESNNEKDEEVEGENNEVEQKEETKGNEEEKNEEKDRKKDEGEATEKHNNTKDETLVERNVKTISENVDDGDDGESMSSDNLPNTATNFYNLIALGGLLTFIGIISFAIRNKAKSFSEK